MDCRHVTDVVQNGELSEEDVESKFNIKPELVNFLKMISKLKYNNYLLFFPFLKTFLKKILFFKKW